MFGCQNRCMTAGPLDNCGVMSTTEELNDVTCIARMNVHEKQEVVHGCRERVDFLKEIDWAMAAPLMGWRGGAFNYKITE
jgi:hypothetical protein